MGNFTNGGREYYPSGHAPEVNVYDFVDKNLGKAVFYGIYDLQHHAGFVNLGGRSDTAECAVNSLRCWWKSLACWLYASGTALLITTDGGESNGSRVRFWKLASVFTSAINLQKPVNGIKLNIECLVRIFLRQAKQRLPKELFKGVAIN